MCYEFVSHPQLTIGSSTVERVSSTKSWECKSGPPTPYHSQRRPNSDFTFCARWKEQSSSTNPHHILQGHHWECAEYLHRRLVRELQHGGLQDPRADSKHSVPLPSILDIFISRRSSKATSIGSHPLLLQPLPTPSIRSTVQKYQGPLSQTVKQFLSPGCKSP